MTLWHVKLIHKLSNREASVLVTAPDRPRAQKLALSHKGGDVEWKVIKTEELDISGQVLKEL